MTLDYVYFYTDIRRQCAGQYPIPADHTAASVTIQDVAVNVPEHTKVPEGMAWSN